MAKEGKPSEVELSVWQPKEEENYAQFVATVRSHGLKSGGQWIGEEDLKLNKGTEPILDLGKDKADREVESTRIILHDGFVRGKTASGQNFNGLPDIFPATATGAVYAGQSDGATGLDAKGAAITGWNMPYVLSAGGTWATTALATMRSMATELRHRRSDFPSRDAQTNNLTAPEGYQGWFPEAQWAALAGLYESKIAYNRDVYGKTGAINYIDGSMNLYGIMCYSDPVLTTVGYVFDPGMITCDAYFDGNMDPLNMLKLHIWDSKNPIGTGIAVYGQFDFNIEHRYPHGVITTFT
jgi:hypothetical protein